MEVPNRFNDSHGMPRKRRLHLPGAAFHITARTQAGEKLFTEEIRTSIFDAIEEATSCFGHTLLAQAIMPNHLHIVLRQGETPLGWLMQRVMQKAIHQVRRVHGGQGHVFGEPYWSGVCGNPAYIRRAIIYTHLNPCKANLCSEPAKWPWTSHNKYVSAAAHGPHFDPTHGLMLFAYNNAASDRLPFDYMRFVEYCIERRKLAIPGDWLLPEGPNRALLPEAPLGDSHWVTQYSSFTEAASFTRPNVDVRTHAIALLKVIAADVSIDNLRLWGHTRALRTVRRQVVEGLITAGCKGAPIGRCLNLSESYVSRVRTGMRGSAS